MTRVLMDPGETPVNLALHVYMDTVISKLVILKLHIPGVHVHSVFTVNSCIVSLYAITFHRAM